MTVTTWSPHETTVVRARRELGLDHENIFNKTAVMVLPSNMQELTGLDEATWAYHRRSGDSSRWFQEAIKDEELANEAAEIDGDDALLPDASRARIHGVIERRCTAPAMT
jgi:hypothetical protein